ncbi:MAG: acetyl-CoA carboxylase, biotin carboxyl carrier protein, partial [Pseudomonadota bacterium]
MTAKDAKTRQDIETDLIKELAELLNETGLSEIEIERNDLRVRVARQLMVASGGASTVPVGVAGPAAAAGPAGGSGEADPGDPSKHPGAVKSPMVGTAYRAPEP